MSRWDQIVEVRPHLLAYARALADTAADAEDLVSDALERAGRSADIPGEPDALKRWLFRVIRNLNIDELRKRRVRREYADGIDRHWSGGEAQDHGPEDAVLVRLALEALKPHQREVLVLVDVLGMTYAEAGAVMDVPHGTVMSRVSRARRALLAKLETVEGMPPQQKRGR